MCYIFGDYVLNTQRQELQHAGAPIRLRRKVFQVLAYLLVHREQVVSKQELLEHVWPDQFVGDKALKSCIKALRKALEESRRTPRFIRTLHGQGYRFVAAVEVQEPLPANDVPLVALPDALRGQPHGVALRLGLHTGPVVVAPLVHAPQSPYTAVGDTLTLATRLLHQAAPDALLLSAATYALVQAEVQGTAWAAGPSDALVSPVVGYVVHGLLRRRASHSAARGS